MDDTSTVALDRPDVIELLGPAFDRPSAAPAGRTLIICAAPRSGSNELCRYLIAAGIGVPTEYFHPRQARPLAQRWGFAGDPLGAPELGRYIDLLRRRRSHQGLFAAKIQFWHFDKSLRNAHGATLFDGACVVHLFRPDVASQFASLLAAYQSGIWDFSGRRTTAPLTLDATRSSEFINWALKEINWIVGEDAGFRSLFVLLGIRPIFVSTDDLFADPGPIVRRIGAATGVAVDEEGLQRSIAASAPYGRDRQRDKTLAELKELLKKVAFTHN